LDDIKTNVKNMYIIVVYGQICVQMSFKLIVLFP